MQPKPFPESQHHRDWRESKSRCPFFRSLLDLSRLISAYWSTAAHNFLYTSAHEPRRSIRIVVRARLVTMKTPKSF
jgi:hypothetical protein